MGLGGAGGAGGLIHGLVAVHRLTGDAAPLDAATAIARAVRDGAIDADERLDLMGGAAGLCLGLLALHRETGDEVVLAKARRAGERLVSRQRPEPEGGAAWPTWSGAALCFPSHGASGIALALARLADRAGQERFAGAAALALEFEDACYDPERGGWPDRRDHARAGPPAAQWCHGAAGVGITRLALRGTAVGAARAGADDAALAAAVAGAGRDFPERDNLCCGAAGVAEFVRAAGDAAAGSPVEAAASEWADDVAARVIAGDPVVLFARAVGGLPAPGLYLGLAGIGMALLGRRDPDLPGVLLWH
jgi:lantibiotic modifying enzyme